RTCEQPRSRGDAAARAVTSRRAFTAPARSAARRWRGAGRSEMASGPDQAVADERDRPAVGRPRGNVQSPLATVKMRQDSGRAPACGHDPQNDILVLRMPAYALVVRQEHHQASVG